MSNNHRSATVSPSSENSPSTEGCGMMPNDLQSEEGSYAGSHAHNHRNSGGGVGGRAAMLSILAKIHFRIHLTVAKVLIHNQQQVRVMIYFFAF